MTETVGTAAIKLELDLSGYSLSVASAKTQATGLGAAAEAAFNQSNAKSKAAAVSLAKYIELVGRSTDEAKILRAQWAGIPTPVLDELGSKLAAIRQEEALTATNAQLLSDSWTSMQAKAKAAFRELQAANVADQLRIDEAAARDVNAQLALMATNTKLAQERMLLLTSATQANATAAQAASAAITQGLVAEREARANALNASSSSNTSQAQAASAAITQGLINQRAAQSAVTKEVKEAGIVFDKYGLSAKQTAAALRQVPAQLTDIVVSLQGGQKPLTVLLQQGGQLKDVFGGVIPAVRALSGALLDLLLNPIVLVTAAVAALALAYKGGSDEQDEFNKSLILTGAYSGETTATLASQAAQMRSLSLTSHDAADALAQVTATGKITGSSIVVVATAAAQAQSVLGRAVKDTVAEFVALAGDPVNAIAKLNETQHFLTDAVYEQIKALEQQGKTQEAAALAEQTYANAIADRTKDIKANLGTLQTAWMLLGQGAKISWDAMMGVGRSDTGEEKLRGLQLAANAAAIAYDKLLHPSAAGKIVNKFMDAGFLEKQLADFKAASDAATKAYHDEEHRQQDDRDKTEADKNKQDANDIAVVIGQEADKYKSAEAKRVADIAAIRGQADIGIAKAYKAHDTKLAAQIEASAQIAIAGINSKAPKPNTSLANAQADAQLQAIKDTQTKEQAVIQNASKLLQAQYSARLVTSSDYYAQQKALLDQDTAAQEKSLQAQIAYLQSRDVAGKDSVKTSKLIGEAEAALAKARADGANADKLLAVQQADTDKKRELTLRSYTDALQSSLDASKADADAAVARISLGDKEATQLQKIAAIRQKGAEDEKQLAREFADNQDKDLYDEKLRALQEYVNQQVEITERGYAQLNAAQADWLNGVKSGIADWSDATANVAEQTNTITKKELDETAGAFANLALTGKFEVKTLLKDILTEIVNFEAKQAIVKFGLMFASLFAPSGGGGTGAYTGTGGANSGFNAVGNVFTNSPDLSRMSGSVVSSPTFFTAYAKGGNVMGEAGPEAILPLQRNSKGQLGISAAGGGGDVYLSTNLTINSNGTSQSSTSGDAGSAYKQLLSQVNVLIEAKLTRAMMPGGELWKAGVTTR